MLLLAGWLGAAIFFSAAVAPAAFGVLRSLNVQNAGEIAGAIVNRTLSVVNTSGFVIGLFSMVVGLLIKGRYRLRIMVAQLSLLVVLVLATGVGQWVIAARMRTLRLAMDAPIDLIAPNDPNRVAFAALHGYSVAALSIAIIAGLITFFVVGKIDAGRDGIGNHRTT